MPPSATAVSSDSSPLSKSSEPLAKTMTAKDNDGQNGDSCDTGAFASLAGQLHSAIAKLEAGEDAPQLPPHLIAPPALLADARALDAADKLASRRARFSHPVPVYLCGNSLGLQPRSTIDAVNAHLCKWARHAVNGHFEAPEPWVSIEDSPAALSLPVVGARFEHEVAICNSLTVNLHLMLVAFYRPTAATTTSTGSTTGYARYRILVEKHLFPSDIYALQTHIRSRYPDIDPDDAIVQLAPRKGEHTLRDDDIIAAIDAHADQLALVFLPGVQYFTGQVFPMGHIAARCQHHGITCGLGLAHAVGNVELRLHDWGVDFAVWCTYKYLNGGPGAVAGLFVHDKHSAHGNDNDNDNDAADRGGGQVLHRFSGWWGHERSTRFDMRADFTPRPGALGFQLSNPPVLAVAPVTAALRELAAAGGVGAVRVKSVALCRLLDRVLAELLPAGAVQMITPTEPERRGAQASLRLCVPGSEVSMREVQARLEKNGVVCDVREPNVLRFAFAPMYNRFEDVVWFGVALRDAMRHI